MIPPCLDCPGVRAIETSLLVAVVPQSMVWVVKVTSEDLAHQTELIG